MEDIERSGRPVYTMSAVRNAAGNAVAVAFANHLRFTGNRQNELVFQSHPHLLVKMVMFRNVRIGVLEIHKRHHDLGAPGRSYGYAGEDCFGWLFREIYESHRAILYLQSYRTTDDILMFGMLRHLTVRNLQRNAFH